MGKSTTNEKDPRVTSTGPSENHTTNAKDSTGINTAQLELKLEFEADLPVKKVRKFSRKSTAIEAQYERIDRAFDYVGKLISTLDFRNMGVLHPAGRIKEMNEKMGYDIRKADLRTVIDEQGFAHLRIAFYELIDRPTKGE